MTFSRVKIVIVLTVLISFSTFMAIFVTLVDRNSESKPLPVTPKSVTQKLEAALAIPKIIHQSWKTKTPPKRMAKWAETWRTKNKGWEYKLWTDDENREMIKNEFPWFLETYDNFPLHILSKFSLKFRWRI
jgi:mannosyltransferase OCH1-like enzyme